MATLDWGLFYCGPAGVGEVIRSRHGAWQPRSEVPWRRDGWSSQENSRERTRGMSTFNGFKATKEALATASGASKGSCSYGRATSATSWRLSNSTWVVLGQFKRGKSTLINALLGAD